MLRSLDFLLLSSGKPFKGLKQRNDVVSSMFKDHSTCSVLNELEGPWGKRGHWEAITAVQGKDDDRLD